MASYCPQFKPSDWLESESSWDWPESQSISSEELRVLALIDERVRKALAHSQTSVAEPIEERFREQANKWKRETGHLSSPTQKIMHPSYQAILGMGREVLPLLLRDLSQNRTDWFWALSYITQENPIRREDAGKMDKMLAAWIDWGRTRGLL
jgi:hypothetical protein